MTAEPNGHKYECSNPECKAKRFIGIDDARKGQLRCLKCGQPMVTTVRREIVVR